MGWWGGDGLCVRDGFIVFRCFVDIKEGLADRRVGLMWTLEVGAFESGMEAGLSSCLAGRVDMVACVVFTSTELASDLLSVNCGVVSKALAGVALAVRLCVSVCSKACLYYSYK